MTVRAIVLVTAMTCGACGSSWIGQTSEAREQPRLEAIDVSTVPRDTVTLPNLAGSIKFAVIGDGGRGWPPQHEVAAQMVAYRQRFDYRFVLMAGDNIYEGPATAEDYRLKFEEPYKLLLDAGVRFYAVLGNHDDPQQIHYKPFNMDGHRYYTFIPPVDLPARLDTRVRFFALDSTNLDGEQMRWFEHEAAESRAEWKIALLHYPLYTSGRYALQSRATRFTLESSFVNGGIDVVFSGHEHLYNRSELQKGILYFVSGAAGSLRQGDGGRTSTIARSYAADFHFMLVEIADEAFHFQAINRQGETIDAGSLRAVAATEDTAARR
ncbi:MAG TPA: metallophosphoesterase [Vicinamibacterales bacterium]|nr:metallophosphoesterase [Vicinamibacterales bacterium]